MLFNPVEIIRKKRDGGKLSDLEISEFINKATKKEIPEYQVSSLLMATFFKGMDLSETVSLTKAMIQSGEQIKFKDSRPKIDKHSTGGVGDKVSIALAPLVASLNVDVPMVSGRGLGHTGGTLDKLESIPGFNTQLTIPEFIQTVEANGFAMMGQTNQFVPADKLLYSLRDVTATVECIPLITASILSKKVAEGISGLILDIKTGSGAFMVKLKDAETLSKMLVQVGNKLGLKIHAMITDMNQPLGNKVGHTLEIIECIEVLQGKGPKDLTALTIAQASHMLVLASTTSSLTKAEAMARQNIQNGKALAKFSQICKSQGAFRDPVLNLNSLRVSQNKIEIKAKSGGFISAFDTRKLGMMLVALGGGRTKVSDHIDFTVGYDFSLKLGEKCAQNQTILTVYYNPAKNSATQLADIQNEILSSIGITKTRQSVPKLIKKVIQK